MIGVSHAGAPADHRLDSPPGNKHYAPRSSLVDGRALARVRYPRATHESDSRHGTASCRRKGESQAFPKDHGGRRAGRVMGEDYVRTARAKGLGDRIVVWRHALVNAMLPILTVSGTAFGALLGGSVAVERAFGVPGLGLALVFAIAERDWMLIQNLVLLYGVIFVLINLVDLSYGTPSGLTRVTPEKRLKSLSAETMAQPCSKASAATCASDVRLPAVPLARSRLLRIRQ